MNPLILLDNPLKIVMLSINITNLTVVRPISIMKLPIVCFQIIFLFWQEIDKQV